MQHGQQPSTESRQEEVMPSGSVTIGEQPPADERLQARSSEPRCARARLLL